jgi:hypothetical protein
VVQGDKKYTRTNQGSTDVKFSGKGFAFAEGGKTRDYLGIIPLIEESEKHPFREYPQLHGVLIYNRTTNCLELSDPENQTWICVSSGTTTTVTGTFASHLGTTDGSTDGVLASPSFEAGRVATPTTSGNPYYTGTFDDDTNQDITSSDSLLWSLTGGSQLTDLQSGTITVEYSDGSGSTIATEVLTPDGSLNNQVSIPNGYVQITSLQDNLDRIEGYLQIAIPANALLSGTGYLKIDAVQEVDSVSYPQSLEFFLDKGNAPSINSQSVSLDVAVVNHLSGLKYAALGSSLQVDLDADDMWKDTYRSDLLQVQGSDLGLGTYLVNYNDVKYNSWTFSGFGILSSVQRYLRCS